MNRFKEGDFVSFKRTPKAIGIIAKVFPKGLTTEQLLRDIAEVSDKYTAYFSPFEIDRIQEHLHKTLTCALSDAIPLADGSRMEEVLRTGSTKDVILILCTCGCGLPSFDVAESYVRSFESDARKTRNAPDRKIYLNPLIPNCEISAIEAVSIAARDAMINMKDSEL